MMIGNNSKYKRDDDIMESRTSVSNARTGAGNSYTTQFRQFDPRTGRWWSRDPIVKAWESVYAGHANNPIYYTDPLGADVYKNSEGVVREFGEKGESFTDDAGVDWTWDGHSPDGTAMVEADRITDNTSFQSNNHYMEPTVALWKFRDNNRIDGKYKDSYSLDSKDRMYHLYKQSYDLKAQDEFKDDNLGPFGNIDINIGFIYGYGIKQKNKNWLNFLGDFGEKIGKYLRGELSASANFGSINIIDGSVTHGTAVNATVMNWTVFQWENKTVSTQYNPIFWDGRLIGYEYFTVISEVLTFVNIDLLNATNSMAIHTVQIGGSPSVNFIYHNYKTQVNPYSLGATLPGLSWEYTPFSIEK